MRKVNGVIITADTDSVRDAHYKTGGHWFDTATLRFFSSRIGRRVYGHRYFVTSECGPSGIRTYTVRQLTDTGSIETVGEFEQYATSAAANRAAAKLAKENEK